MVDITLEQISIENSLRRQLFELALACRVLAMEGHEDVAQGHLSLRDPECHGIWLKRRGLGLSEVRSAEDFTLLDFDGNQLAGSGRHHSEWPIHSEVMLARPEIQVGVHTHPHYATLFSALEEEFVLSLVRTPFGRHHT